MPNHQRFPTSHSGEYLTKSQNKKICDPNKKKCQECVPKYLCNSLYVIVIRILMEKKLPSNNMLTI